MSDEATTTTDAPTEPAGATAPQDGAATPPWGSDEEFNPQRAWDLITNLRGDVETAKSKAGETEALQAKLREFEDAQLSEQEKATRDLEELRTGRDSLALENARLKAAIEHGLSADHLDLLGGANPEEIAEKAAKLADLLRGSGAPPTKPLTTRPTEALRGGTDPTTPAQGTDWLRDALTRSD